MTTTLMQAKAQARRMHAAMRDLGQPVTLARAYEILAQSAGHADWNTMAAELRQSGAAQAAPVAEPVAELGAAGLPRQLGAPVSGRYLGQPFAGRVHALRRKGAAHLEIEIALDQPVNVSRSALFEALRRRVRATIGPEGRSVGATSDGVPHLVLDAG